MPSKRRMLGCTAGPAHLWSLSVPQKRCAILAFTEQSKQHTYWDSLAILQGSFGPFACKVAKRVRNEFPDPLGSGAPKKHQEPRKGGFSKRGFCRVERHAQGNKKCPKGFGPAVNWTHRSPQPREAYVFAKTLLKPLFLFPEKSRKRRPKRVKTNYSSTVVTLFRLHPGLWGAGLLEAPKPPKNQSRRKIGQK